MTIVAPTERDAIRLLPDARVNLTPERYGVDFLWVTKPAGLVGVQRKAFPSDFIASVTDGRLAKEVGQMQRLDVKVLVLEGRPQWTTEGELVAAYGQRWTVQSHRSFLWSMRAAGVWVDWTDDVDDTVAYVRQMEEWSRKAKHQSLMRRPMGGRDGWGVASNRLFQEHLLMGLPDVGPELAGRIIDTLGMPFGWRVEEADLLRVHGIGKTRARKMMKALEVIEAVGPGAESVSKIGQAS